MTTKRKTSDSRMDGGSKFEKDLTDVVEKRTRILLDEGANAPVDWNWTCPEVPPYYDPEKFNLGQEAFRKNFFAMMVAKLAGLVTLLTVPTILDVIVFTKQSSTPCTAFRRYTATIFHTFVWYRRKPGYDNEFLESLKIVHKKHCVAFRKSAEAGLRRISQLDMALTQFGFVGYILTRGEQLGVVMTPEEEEGLVHLWRVVGYMLGMEEKYNLCNATVEEARALCGRLLDDVFLPNFAKSRKNFNEMGRILLEGLWPSTPMMTPEEFTTFTFYLASHGATNNNRPLEIDLNSLSPYSRFMFRFQLFVHRYLLQPEHWWSNIFRPIINAQLRLSMFLTEYFPFLAYWKFGVKRSHVDIFRYTVNDVQ